MNRIASIVTAAGATALALATVGAFALTSGFAGGEDDDDDHEWAERNALFDGSLAATGAAVAPATGASSTGAAVTGGAVATERRGTETRAQHDLREREQDDDDDDDRWDDDDD